MGDELTELDATAQADLVRRGEATPLELVDASISAIEELNRSLNAIITPLFDKARERASGRDLPDGPFRGVPMVLKDFICHSAGDPFFEGMGLLKDLGWTESDDTYLAAKFREAGFIFVGKSNTPELGLMADTQPNAFGPTRNPWDTTRTPFGSSGGTAAAVASRMVPVGHGNDGGGSIRLPASACGLVGLKPSRGRVSLAPEFGDLFGGFAVEHVLTRSVRDSAAVLDAVSGPAPGEPFVAPPLQRPLTAEIERPPGRLRIAVMRNHSSSDIEPACVDAVDSTARLLETLGHDVEVAHPPAMEDPTLTDVFMRQFAAGAAWAIDHYWAPRIGRPIVEQDVESITWRVAEMGRSSSGADYLADREAVQVCGRSVAQWMDGHYDLLLTPTTPVLPPPVGGRVPMSVLLFTMPFNITGQPAISLPLHHDANGLPVGVQLAAEFGREDQLIRLAAQLEAARPWQQRMPPVLARRDGNL